MSAGSERRFAGIERLLGVSGAHRIAQAHVAVVGIGGVGSWAAEALARSGVGRITLIDLDHIAESNINRQIHATEASVGQAKVLAMRDRIHAFAPLCQVHPIDEFVSPDNWPTLLTDPIDGLIDACDQLTAKLAMAVWAKAQGTRVDFVSVGAAGGKRMAHGVRIADLSTVTHDPLLAKLRYRMRREFGAPRDGKRMGVDCVFSAEAVSPPDPSCGLDSDGSLNCHGYGSLVTVTATFGQCAAGIILNKLAKRT
jgi:tRNA A37 threonylcarbamoyladenosine dehydratase